MNKFLLILWLALTGAGFCYLLDYDMSPGGNSGSAKALNMVPSATYELVTFIHPGCPCSRNTLRQLQGLSESLGPKLHVTINLADAGREEDRDEVVGAAAMIKNAIIKDDAGGNAAAEANATTSGECHLYDPRGKLIFSGGITNGRSHPEASAGSEFIKKTVLNGANGTLNTVVYGCSLADSATGAK